MGTGRQRCTVGFFVLVEVEAYEHEAYLVAEAACNLPGSWTPPRPPVEMVGELDGKSVTARVIRSEALMVKVQSQEPGAEGIGGDRDGA